MNQPIRIVLVRHGEPSSSGSEKDKAGLSANGMKQARAAGDCIGLDQSVVQILTSNLPRARQTAEIISERIVRPVQIVPELEEVHLGDWTGKEPQEIRKKSPQLIERFQRSPEDFQIPGGEKLSVFLRRMRDARRRIVREAKAGTVVVVAHRIIIAFLICEFLDKDPRAFTQYMPNEHCGISVLTEQAAGEFKLDHFDMKPSAEISEAKRQENWIFMGISFTTALFAFGIAFSLMPPPKNLRNAAFVCFLIALSAYFRYLFKYWDFWRHVPPMNFLHDKINWLIMLVGSIIAVSSSWPSVFLGLWALCYTLISWKERLAINEYADLVRYSPGLEKLRTKSKLALVKGAVFAISAGVDALWGRKEFRGTVDFEMFLLWLILTWTGYALLRDIISSKARSLVT
jgi:probable phosphoglycerate mutase